MLQRTQTHYTRAYEKWDLSDPEGAHMLQYRQTPITRWFGERSYLCAGAKTGIWAIPSTVRVPGATLSHQGWRLAPHPARQERMRPSRRLRALTEKWTAFAKSGHLADPWPQGRDSPLACRQRWEGCFDSCGIDRPAHRSKLHAGRFCPGVADR